MSTLKAASQPNGCLVVLYGLGSPRTGQELFPSLVLLLIMLILMLLLRGRLQCSSGAQWTSTGTKLINSNGLSNERCDSVHFKHVFWFLSL